MGNDRKKGPVPKKKKKRIARKREMEEKPTD